VTVHDLAVLRHPEWFNRWTAWYSRLAVPRVLRAATRLIAVSEFTKREIASLVGVDAARIDVVQSRLDPCFVEHGQRGPRRQRRGAQRLSGNPRRNHDFLDLRAEIGGLPLAPRPLHDAERGLAGEQRLGEGCLPLPDRGQDAHSGDDRFTLH